MLLNEGTNWKRKLLMKKNRNNAANRMLNFKWFHFCCFRSPTEISTHLSKGHIFGVLLCYSAINKHKSQGTSVSWRSSNYRRAWGIQIVSEVCFFPGEWLPASFTFWLAMSSTLGLLITAIVPAPPSLCLSLSVCNMTYAQLIVRLCWPWNDEPTTNYTIWSAHINYSIITHVLHNAYSIRIKIRQTAWGARWKAKLGYRIITSELHLQLFSVSVAEFFNPTENLGHFTELG